jgi:hypothetical protein
VANCTKQVTAPPRSGDSSPLSSLSRSPTPFSGTPILRAALRDIKKEMTPLKEITAQDSDATSNAQDEPVPAKIKIGNNEETINHQTAQEVPVNAISSTPGNQQIAYPTISAYITNEVEKLVDGKNVTQLEYEMEFYDDSGEDTVVVTRKDDVGVEDEAPSATPVALDEKEDSAPTDSQEVNTDVEMDSQPTVLKDEQIPSSQPADSDIIKDTPVVKKSIPTKKFQFKKLNSAENFIEYLSNPEELSFDELYYRTSQTAAVLKALQDEYNDLDFKTKEANAYEKEQVKLAKEAAKELEEKNLRQEEPDLINVLAKYEEQLKQREKGWKVSLLQIQESGLEETDPDTFSRLLRLRNDTKLRADITEKMLRAQAEDPDSIQILVDKPAPKVSKKRVQSDQVQKRSYLEDPVRFDDRRMMDAYGLVYSAAESKVGSQELRDRNAVDENGDTIYENGRPKRSRAKRAIYDTEASKEASADEEEVLPAKRRRTQRNPDDADGFGGDVSRGQTPAPRVFKSGKRIGRPPKSLAKSRLNEAHLAQAAENAGGDPSQSGDEEQSSKIERIAGSQKLNPSQENDLINSATSLVSQTLSDQGLSEDLPKDKFLNARKPRGRVARAKKQHKVDENESDIDDVKPRGKDRRKSKVLSNPFVEDDDLLQSTEQDDQSRFASASTSRPTSSSSRLTRSTLNSRANSRPRTAGAEAATNEAPGVSTRGRGGKRKTNGVDTQYGDAAEPETTGAPPKRRRVSTKKQEESAEAIEETARPKRKRATTQTADSIEVVRPEQPQDAAEAEEAPKTKRKRIGTSKSKAAKVETESDFVEEEDEELAPRKKSRTFSKKAKSSGDGDNDEVAGDASGESEGEDVKSETERKPSSKKPKAKPARKSKGKGNGADEIKEADMDPEAYEAMMLKKAQKSAKLSASAKARWAKGLMKGPMEKRARTNAAKAAAKKASIGGGSVATTPSASTVVTGNDSEQVAAFQQPVAQASPQQPSPSQGVFQASVQTPTSQPVQALNAQAAMSAGSAPTRNSKRPRKPTLKAPLSLALDGTGDDDNRRMSQYETFQALSCPGSPMVLGKRIRKPVLNSSAQDDDDDDDDDDDWM